MNTFLFPLVLFLIFNSFMLSKICNALKSLLGRDQFVGKNKNENFLL